MTNHIANRRSAVLALAVGALLALGTACTSSHASDRTPTNSVSNAANVPTTITTPVPPPTPGNIDQTVSPGTAKQLKPVAMTAVALFGNGVTAKVVNIRKISFTAKKPGEISGNAARVEIRLQNGSLGPVDLGNVVVTAQDAAGTPLVAMSSSPSAPMSGAIDAGKQATGVYVFNLPTQYRSPLTMSLSYSTAVPVAIFVGGVK